MSRRLYGLWRHTDFLRFWAGHTFSVLGSTVTALALPLMAASILQVTPGQMGILEAAGALPALLFGLFAGVWVDRHHRRPLLIAADVGQAALLVSIPLATTFGLLYVEYLYIVAFLLSTLGLLSGVANHPYLLSLVGREQLVDANSKLATSRSVADIVGSSSAGWLVERIGAPFAVVVDAVSHLLRGSLLWSIRTAEPIPQRTVPEGDLWREIKDGLGLVASDRTLGAIAGCTAMLGLSNSALEAVWILYVTRELVIAPRLLGLLFAGGGAGFLIGALLSERIARRLGLGPAIIGGILLAAVSDLLTPLASGTTTSVAIILAVAQFSFGLGLTVYEVGQVSLWQAITPDHLQGRVAATLRVLASGVVPLGALGGGALGGFIGLRATLIVATLGEVLSVGWLLLSPLRSLHDQPKAE